jgi:glycosyltransferase involved in cell wall biosynthesis
MRVLMVTQFYPPTIVAQEKVIQDLSNELISRGHHVAVATLGQEGEPWRSDISDVRVYRIRSSFGRLYRGYVDPLHRHVPPVVDPEAMADLRRVIRVEKPDIVHGNDWLIHSLLPLKRRDGPGLVVTLHDYSLVCANKRLIRGGEACNGPAAVKCLRCSSAYYGTLKGSAITLGNRAMTAAERALVDMFLPVSQAVADAAGLRQRGNPHVVIPNFVPSVQDPRLGLDGDLSDAQSQVLAELPSEFVFFAGDIVADKGVGVLLKAHESLESMPMQRHPPLVLMGPVLDADLLARAVGPIRANHPRLLSAAMGPVRVFGPQPHEVVFRALRQCTVAVLPSLVPEASSLVVVQAMRAGRAVIAANIGGLPELITDGEDGILVAPGDVSALRDALARVLGNPEFRTQIGAAARQRAAEFAAERLVPQIEQSYAEVLEARRKRVAQRRPRKRLVAAADGRLRVLAAQRVVRLGGRAHEGVLAARRTHLSSAAVSAGARRIWGGLHRREPRLVLALTALAVVGTALPGGAWSVLRVILVVPLVLFLPGYTLTTAIFRRQAPGWVERIALALSLSLVITALVSVFLYVTPFGLTVGSWTVALALVTAAAAVAAAAHLGGAPAEPAHDRPRLVVSPRRWWAPIAMGVAAAGITAAAVALARTPLPSPSAPGYTALWLTDAPRSTDLIVGVRSQEHRRTRYVLRLELSGQTTKRQLVLAPGQTWQETLPPARRAAAWLQRVGHPGVYRSVRLRSPVASGR